MAQLCLLSLLPCRSSSSFGQEFSHGEASQSRPYPALDWRTASGHHLPNPFRECTNNLWENIPINKTMSFGCNLLQVLSGLQVGTMCEAQHVPVHKVEPGFRFH